MSDLKLGVINSNKKACKKGIGKELMLSASPCT